MLKKSCFIFCKVMVILLLLSSCNSFNEMWGDHSLGNNLSLLEGDKLDDRVIVYCSGRNLGACYGGIAVVPIYQRQFDEKGNYAEYVETATSNKKWVIVKTIRKKEAKTNYWIISKNFDTENLDCTKMNCDSILQSYVTGPLNLSEFENKKRTFNIGLNFK